MSEDKRLRFALFGNEYQARKSAGIEQVLACLHERKAEVYIDRPFLEYLTRTLHVEVNPDSVFDDYNFDVDYAISIGGDGTFLTSAAAIGNKNIPILGVNCGHLGFLAEVQTQDLDDILQKLVAGEYSIERRHLLSLTILDKDGIKRDGLVMAPNALNEIAILKQGLTNMLTIETKVNGEFLHTYHSDGLIIATPTGSTAYNLSIGGPLVVPQNRGMILTPIAPHSLTVRPIVMPDEWKIDLRVSSRYDTYMVSVDGRSQSLSTDMSLHIERAPYTVKVVQIGDNSFLKSLQNKLNWGK